MSKTQEELEGMPNSALREKILEAIQVREKLKKIQEELNGINAEIILMASSERKKKLNIVDDSGKTWAVTLKSSAVHLKISEVAEKKQKE